MADDEPTKTKVTMFLKVNDSEVLNEVGTVELWTWDDEKFDEPNEAGAVGQLKIDLQEVLAKFYDRETKRRRAE